MSVNKRPSWIKTTQIFRVWDFLTSSLWDSARLRRELGWTWWQCVVVEWYISDRYRLSMEDMRDNWRQMPKGGAR